MKCADPVLCYITASGQKVYRHFSLASDSLKYLHRIKKDPVFNCGKCLYCRKKRAYELACKCVLHSSLYSENCFLTLTYDEKRKDYHNEFQYEDIQKFKKRLRQKVWREFGKKIEIFNVHEYGKNGKKHWHLVVFNWRPSDCVLHTVSDGNPLYQSESLAKTWSFGFATVGDVSEASAMYTSQYMEKDFKNFHTGTKKKSHSKHSGIGKPYFLKHYKQILSLGYVPINGRKLPVPRSFQKIAHKHWCHFYEKSAFFDTADRKALYRPFKLGMENKELADLWSVYASLKTEKIKEYEDEWDAVISQYLTTGRDPDFIKSNQNALHDLRNRSNFERF